MPAPRISLEQWRALVAVVDAGGYARAAEVLSKTQSAVSYSIQKLESVLGVKVFEIHGRKARLTPVGAALHRRAQALLDEAASVERAAQAHSAGWEAEIRLAVEIVFPTWLLLECLAKFGDEAPNIHVELVETVLGGTPEALLQGRVDLAISPQVPPGFLGDPLMRMRFVPVAHPSHPLHWLGRTLGPRDLRNQRHLVVRDSGSKRRAGTGTLDAKQRWTVSHMATSIAAARAGYGWAWFPEDKIRDELTSGELAPLKLREGNERFVELYLILADREAAGPGVLRLAEVIRERVADACAARAQAGRAKKPKATRAVGKTP